MRIAMLKNTRTTAARQTGAIHFVGIFIIMAIVITGYIQFAGEAEKEENAQRMSQYCLELAKRGISTRACEGLVTASKTPAAPVGPAQ